MLSDGRWQDVKAFRVFAKAFVLRFVRGRHRRRDDDAFWRGMGFRPGKAGAALDVPALIFTTIARDYAAVVEIGAAEGGRILAVKRGNPDVTTLAFDISYSAVQEVDGVTFAPYTDDEAVLRQVPCGALVMAVGTLTCFSPKRLHAFVGGLKVRGCALAYVEPAPVFKSSRAIRRRLASGAWFHAYDQLMSAAGFTSQVTAPWLFNVMPETLERRVFGYWHP